MTSITVQHYNEETHGYMDDCDYVVGYTTGLEHGLEDEAHRIATMLSICDYYVRENGNYTQLFCCHA